MAGARDDFTSPTKRLLATRVAYRCSNPDCRKLTIGPATEHDKTINLGVAAHICAAAPGGMRYDVGMTPQERASVKNGIWLCMGCSKLVDSDAVAFTVEGLHEWRGKNERATIRESQLGRFVVPSDAIPFLEDLEGNAFDLTAKATSVDLAKIVARAHAAAVADIASFKLGAAWPNPTVQIALAGKDEKGPFEVTDLASVIRVGRELSVVASPGTGKTTTLIQAADSILAAADETVAFIPLGNWSTDNCDLIESIAKRAAFAEVSSQDLLLLAKNDRLTILLDGWNELDRAARCRAAGEIERRQREYPLLRIIISTRRQAMDLPIGGPIVEVQPLSEQQQLAIARGAAGENGVMALDGAWRTPGVRDLMAIPLYLQAFVSGDYEDAIPATKEEILRLFVDRQEKKPNHEMPLNKVTFGAHREFLNGLGVEATRTANTTILDSRAKSVVLSIGKKLISQGQIDELLPNAVLEVLVDHSVLVRQGEHAISFQHQQFQEWYSSFDVETTMLLSSDGDYKANGELISSILNMPAWEEAILFACERLSRKNETAQKAVSDAIIETLSIDPMLAADMVFRSTDAVWHRAKDDILSFVDRWHTAGAVDRASRFMIMTGRSEFCEKIWPLISNDDGIHLNVLRVAPHFRSSVLGSNAEDRLLDLPEKLRGDILGEIAGNSGIDGMEFSARVAQKDKSSMVQLSVIEALMFRRGTRLAQEILHNATDQLWSEVAEVGWLNDFNDPEITARIQNERLALAKKPNDKARSLAALVDLYNLDDFDSGKEEKTPRAVLDLLSGQDFPITDQQVAWSIEKAFDKFPDIVRSAMLSRLEQGLQLPYNSKRILAGAPIVEVGAIAELALSESAQDKNVTYAASMIGPEAIEKLLATLFKLDAKSRQEGSLPEADRKRYSHIRNKLRVVRPLSFVEVWLARASIAKPEDISLLARIFSDLECFETAEFALSLNPKTSAEVARVLRQWAGILVADKQSRRQNLASLATAIGKFGLEELLDCLIALLDEDLIRRRRQLADFLKSNGRINQHDEARMVYGNVFRRAFTLIGGQATSELLKVYLFNLEFGPEAANTIKDIYENKHLQQDGRQRLLGRPDFSLIEERSRENVNVLEHGEPDVVSSIFGAAEQLSSADVSENIKLALSLACVGNRLPHKHRPELIEKMLTFPIKWAAKREYVISLVLSGETVKADSLLQGIDEFFETAKTEKWRLEDGAWELHSWLELLPYSDRPEVVLDALKLVPATLKQPRDLERILNSLGATPQCGAEEVLFELAERDTRLYGNDNWVSAVLRRKTVSAYTMLFELTEEHPIAMGRFHGSYYEEQVQGFLSNNPGFRSEILSGYKDGKFNRPNGAVEQLLAKSADAETVVELVKRHAALGENRADILRIAIESAVLEHRPLPGQNGAYEVHGKAAPELRKMLFALTKETEAELAAWCLTYVDVLRDKHGRVELEPRHPDIDSKLPWPVEAKTPCH